jgi:hypothetical protein
MLKQKFIQPSRLHSPVPHEAGACLIGHDNKHPLAAPPPISSPISDLIYHQDRNNNIPRKEISFTTDYLLSLSSGRRDCPDGSQVQPTRS